MWEYTDKVRDLFLHPKNVGEIENPDAVGEVGSIVCGDALRLTLRIDRDTDRIVDAKFQTFGCASAIASSSALTELVKGKTLDEALTMSNQDIAGFLGGLPDEKMHCSVMGKEALEAAIASYRGQEVVHHDHEDIVCKCFEVSAEKIRKVAAENHLRTVEDITNFTKAGGGCGTCVDKIEEILRDLWSEKVRTEKTPRARKMTNLQKIALIQEVIEREIRPRLQADGGDLELVDVDGDNVFVALRAMCVACPMGGVTIRSIEEKLRELVSPDLNIHEA